MPAPTKHRELNGFGRTPPGFMIVTDSDGEELCIHAHTVRWIRPASPPPPPNDSPITRESHTMMCVALTMDPARPLTIYTVKTPYRAVKEALANALFAAAGVIEQ